MARRNKAAISRSNHRYQKGWEVRRRYDRINKSRRHEPTDAVELFDGGDGECVATGDARLAWSSDAFDVHVEAAADAEANAQRRRVPPPLPLRRHVVSHHRRES